MKKPSRLIVILYGVCAVIWIIRVILEVVFQTYNDSVFLFILSVLCTAIWIAAFVVLLKRYRANKEDWQSPTCQADEICSKSDAIEQLREKENYGNENYWKEV